MNRYWQLIRDIPDFPKPGILFKDITPLIGSKLFSDTIYDLWKRMIIETDHLLPEINVRNADAIAAPESRGFIIGAALANMLGIGLIPLRKPGKLPYKTVKCCYDLEYGSAEMHMHEDAIQPGQKVVLVDDLLATGGTLGACCELIEKAGGQLLTIGVLIELEALKGREKINRNLVSLIRY